MRIVTKFACNIKKYTLECKPIRESRDRQTHKNRDIQTDKNREIKRQVERQSVRDREKTEKLSFFCVDARWPHGGCRERERERDRDRQTRDVNIPRPMVSERCTTHDAHQTQSQKYTKTLVLKHAVKINETCFKGHTGSLILNCDAYAFK